MKTQKLFTAMAPVLLGVAVVVLLLVMFGQVAMASPGGTLDAPVVADTYIDGDGKNSDKNYGGNNDLVTNSKNNKERYSLLKFDLTGLPTGAEVLTATLNVYENKAPKNGHTITIREITASWDESVVTWDNFGSAFDSGASYGSFDASTTGSKQVDIASLVQRWADGASNYGLLLHPSGADGDAKYDSLDKIGGISASIHIEYDLGVIAVYPNHTQQAGPGEVVSYGHIIANNSGATDSVTVTATSSQTWSLHLWYDQDGNGIQDLGEPDLTSGDTVAISASATYTLGVEVSVPSSATDCTDETVITTTSGNNPGESDSATDTTQVRVIYVDGLLDSGYSYLAHFNKSGSGNEALAPGNLYGYEGTNTCYWAFVVDRAFNDNVYADKDLDDPYMLEDGWTVGHSFGKLKGSDKAIFNVTYTGGSYTDLTLDYLNGDVGNWSSGQTGKDGSANPGNPPIDEAATSLHWNLENSGWDGGTWGDPLKHSPPYTTTLPWEWHMIYEFSIPKSAMNGECGDVDQAGAHNSPNKDNESLGKSGDYVGHDVNINGLQDDGEVGVPGVTVNLYQNGTKVRSTETEPGTSGYYIFNNLEAGVYYIEFVPPDDYNFSPQDQGSDDGVDSDADVTTGETVAITLASGAIDLTWDAGLHLCSVGDRVWNDEDGQGDQNGTEPGFNDVDVYLYSSEPITCGSSTDLITHTITISGTSQTPNGFPDGIYLFDMELLGLGLGDYWVCVDEDTLPTGQWALTTGSNPQKVTYNGTDDFSIDFGYAAKVDLALTKTLDTLSPYSMGQLVTFSITVTNEGSVDATGVQVEDFNWSNLQYVSADSSGYLSGTTSVIWDVPDVGAGVGNLPVGASATMHITFTVATSDGDGSFMNDAEIYACDQEDVDSTPDNGWVVVPDPPFHEDDIDQDGASVIPTAVTLSSFAAKSSPGGSASRLWLGLAGLTVLAAGSLFWTKRRAG